MLNWINAKTTALLPELNTMPDVSFRISSGLKTIIGKELITDDFIAIFELVKNSFDAGATRVDITIDTATKTPRIIIEDNGSGMSGTDIREKWLFVAYSAKKLQADYRNKIRPARVYAGAKGIGRFSCDRLGAKLHLVTRSKREKGNWHVLDVDWSDFEDTPESEFQNIPAHYTTTSRAPGKISYGTTLEITGLRDTWNRSKLIELRRSLERLVNPNQENDADNFAIHLHAPAELDADKVIMRADGEDIGWNVINGPVRNFIFEELRLKTTRVEVRIDDDGHLVTTTLNDRGSHIYTLKERNEHTLLHGISVHLFFLNRAAKFTFTRRMGLRPLHYGSVFLYKNGFRIHPFGDPNEDSFGIDRRKQQGMFRFLGTRDISGRIEINGPNREFQETSSRDGGIIKNDSYEQLREFFIECALKRLEAFVINLQQFGQAGELPDPDKLNEAEIRQGIFDVIAKLTQPKNVVDITYNRDILDLLQNSSESSVTALLGNLRRIAAEQPRPELAREVAKAEKQLTRLARAKDEAESEAEKARQQAKAAEAKTREAQQKAATAEAETRRAMDIAREAQAREQQTSSQNLFLKAVLSKDLDHVLGMHHSIGQDALTIENYVSNALGMLNGDKPVKPEQVRVALERISYVAKRISTLSRFATRANFRADNEEMQLDLVEYVREYLMNVHGGFVMNPQPQGAPIPIRFHQPKGSKFIGTFAPISIGIVLDNLISNARKHKVTNIDVSVLECTPSRLRLSFRDDGGGIPKRNIPKLFDIGFSTTDGSGLGLHHVREVLQDMSGSIEVNTETERGAEFIITFNTTQ